MSCSISQHKDPMKREVMVALMKVLHGSKNIYSFSPILIYLYWWLLLLLNSQLAIWEIKIWHYSWRRPVSHLMADWSHCTPYTMEEAVIHPYQNWYMNWLWICLAYPLCLCQQHNSRTYRSLVYWHRFSSNNSSDQRIHFMTKEEKQWTHDQSFLWSYHVTRLY